MENKTKKTAIDLSIEAAKKAILSAQKEPTLEEKLQHCSQEIIEKYTSGVPLKVILKSLKNAGFKNAKLATLQSICGVETNVQG
jgi:ATP-dependent helicase/DNAse subunit B